MTSRRYALLVLGLFLAPPIDGWATAGETPTRTSGVMGALADAGSSSRDARQRAAAAVPLERMAAAERHVAEQALEQTTLYRHLPTASVACDAALLDFILAKPETLVDVWRVLDISRLALDPSGPGRWRLADGYGTVGSIRVLHRERTERGGLCVFHGRGAYDGPLAPKQLTGSCLVVVRYAAEPRPSGGTPRQAVQIDAFLDVDGLGLELVARTLQPIIVHSAAANVHEIGLFVSQFAAAAARNPAAVARITERMSRTEPADRRTLVALASGGAAGTPPGRSRRGATDDVQTELAARWMTVDQLDGTRLER
jgi:hypothetical protein